jgi:tagatose-1,6-bisphosphate aldolase non-catalytic subunit AgaZ/GatZ
MIKMSLDKVVEKMLNVEEGTKKASLLGIGPMSKTLIKASFLLAKEKDFPLMFIASRNQVDKYSLGGGYVCNWDQKGFKEAIEGIAKEVEFDGLYYLCRDHGGPWQRDNERNDKLDEIKAMDLGKESFLEDLIQGFDLLHIDPTKDPYVVGKVVPMDIVIDRTIELIEYIENERKSRNLPQVSYEVGTEETNGGLTSEDAYEEFIKKLTEELNRKNLPTPAFIVGQTGTLTRLTENVGRFDGRSAKKLADIAKKYSVGLKEHNGDYLADSILLQHPALGITAINVAPEYGTVETLSYFELANAEEKLYEAGIIDSKSNIKEVIITEAVKTGRWKKWMVDDSADKSIEEILADSDLSKQISEIAGHYTFNNDVVKTEINNLNMNLAIAGIDGEKYTIDCLKESLDKYIKPLNMEGLTTYLID